MPKIKRKTVDGDCTSSTIIDPKIDLKTEKIKGDFLNSDSAVTVEYGLTKNLGDYNSLRIMASVTLPLQPSKEDLEKAKESIKVAYDVVEEFVNIKVAEVSA